MLFFILFYCFVRKSGKIYCYYSAGSSQKNKRLFLLKFEGNYYFDCSQMTKRNGRRIWPWRSNPVSRLNTSVGRKGKILNSLFLIQVWKFLVYRYDWMFTDVTRRRKTCSFLGGGERRRNTGSSRQKMEGVELINRTQVGGNRVLKVQQFEEAELIIEIQIRRKFISILFCSL